MNDRRKFLKTILAGGAALGLSSTAGATNLKPSRKIPKGYARQSTIFCQIGDPQLLSDIGLVAQNLGCDIWLGEPFSPDILAVPYFIAIIDRRTLDEKQWAEYLEFRAEVDETIPFFLIDDLSWSIGRQMEILDTRDQSKVRSLLRRIRSAHAAAQTRAPEDPRKPPL